MAEGHGDAAESWGLTPRRHLGVCAHVGPSRAPSSAFRRTCYARMLSVFSAAFWAREMLVPVAEACGFT